LRQGVYLPHACGHGLCGTCKVDILEGDIDIGDEASPFALMDFERDEGKALTCCCTPTSDLVIEADVEEEPDAQNIPVQDYTGKVVRLEKLTPRILGIFLEVEGDGVEFQSGQYANLHIPGLDTPRPFSMAQSPNEKNILEFFTEAKNIVDKEGKSIFFTIHKHAIPQDLMIRIRSICDAHISLTIKEVRDKVIRFINVNKIRGASKSTNIIIGFEVDPAFGVKVIPFSSAKA